MVIMACTGMLLVFLSIVIGRFWLLNGSSMLINWPVVGMIPGLLQNTYRIYDFATDVLEQSHGTFLFRGPWFSGIEFLITSDPMNLYHLLIKNKPNYQKGPEFKQIFEPFGDGIFNSDSDQWKIQRTIIHNFFSDKRFYPKVETTMGHKIFECLFPVLESALKEATEVDLQDIFQRLTFDTTCLLLLGYDPKSLSIELPQFPFQKAILDMEQVAHNRHLLPSSIWKFKRWLQIGEEKKFRKAWGIFDDFLEESIARKRELEETDFNFLTYFLSEDDHQPKFIRDMIFNLLAAGKDTIAAGLVWFFWLVGTHPHVENKILEEIQEVLVVKSRIINFEEMNKLIYLHAAISEALRLYPSLPLNHMVAIEEDILPSGHHVPKNMRIHYSPYTTGRMKETWGQDCMEFKPERWISEQGKLIHVPSYKFIAFNAGPRICLGKNLAFLQLKSIASAFLWNYSFQVLQNQVVRPATSVILYMKNGLKVRISKRFAS